MPRSCAGIADDAAKDKDYKAAAVYYQQACSLGDKKSCGRAEENRKKAGL
jgi:TPR repeat protein